MFPVGAPSLFSAAKDHDNVIFLIKTFGEGFNNIYLNVLTFLTISRGQFPENIVMIHKLN